MENWTSKRLDEIAIVVMGQSPDSKTYTTEEIGMPFLQGCAEFGDKFPKPLLNCSQPNKISTQNSILFSVRAPVGKINFANNHYCIGRGLASISAKEVDAGFLYQNLLYSGETLRTLSQGSTFEAISSEQLKSFKFFVPENKKEQTAIAEVLGKTDSAIEQTQKLIEKQKRIKQGLMQDLLTKGIDEHGNIRSEKTHRFKNSPLGRIPEDWSVTTLADVGKWLSGGTPSKTQSRFWNGTIPWISSKDMKQFYLREYSDYLTKEGANNGTRIIPKDTILIVVRGMILAHTFPVGVTTQETAFNQDLKACVCSPQISPLFIAYTLLSNASNLLRLTTAATHGTKRFDSKDLFDFEIALPKDKEEQESIVKIIENCNAQISLEENKRHKLESAKSGLMQDLLTGKKSVKNLIGE